jgi:hypothetical protein
MRCWRKGEISFAERAGGSETAHQPQGVARSMKPANEDGLIAFGDPQKELPRRRKHVSIPIELFAATDAFRASPENYDTSVLEIQVPKSDVDLKCPGFTFYPPALRELRDVAPGFGPSES